MESEMRILSMNVRWCERSAAKAASYSIIFEKSAPDYFGVIYMDIMMPRMNGLDAARIIREMKRRDAMRVPIIAMSANAFAEDIINSRLAGMNVHLAKPLDAEKMIIALKQCMADNSDVKLHEDL